MKQEKNSNLTYSQYYAKLGDSERGNCAANSLPCLYSGISTESLKKAPQKPSPDDLANVCKLTPHGKKTAFILTGSVHSLAERFGIEHLGFLTLTFSQHITCPRTAQKRFNSLVSHIIKPRYREYVGVMERQKSGRIHYHLLVVLQSDIRTGVDVYELASGNYRTACSALRSEWLFWRKTAPRYGFGRTELMPVRSTSEAIARYVGKYIAKHTESRLEEDKGVRLVRYSQSARIGSSRFQFLSDGSRQWREKCEVFAQIVSSRVGYPVTLENISDVLGKRWAYHNKQFILDLP